MADFVCHVLDAFHIRGRGTVFCANISELALPLRVGDTVEFRGEDQPLRATVKGIESFLTDGPPSDGFGFFVSPDVAADAAKRNPELWRIFPKQKSDDR
jgi:translation elongation factor EF-Tu-like GTPase